MRLRSLEIEGYRSINDKMKLICDPKVTVVLGANDQGKSNLLAAIQHLNVDRPFEAESDLNWDRRKSGDSLPSILYELDFDAHEQQEIHLKLLDTIRRAIIAKHREAAVNSYHNAISEGGPSNLKKKSGSAFAQGGDPSSLNAEIVLKVIESEAAHSVGPEGFELSGALDKANDAHANALSDLSAAESAHSNAVSALTSAQTGGESEAIRQAKAKVDTALVKLNRAKQAVVDTGYNGLLSDAVDYFLAGEYRSALETDLSNAESEYILKTILIERRGINGTLECHLPEELRDETGEIDGLILSMLPRVELISPVDRLEDSVNREQIESTEYEFMRGVFYYAGLDQESWDDIFEQNDATARQLEAASSTLNATLRKSWSQGGGLTFKLQHSAGSRIELYISDPVVRDRYVRASRRSTGFTHFFTLKTILHSRQTESPASSYIWLFDEPGLYLHPNGQHDLLQVIETLSLSNQIIYSTHSLFMINKNFPIRHRLLTKRDNGTRVDGKPYVGQWRAAIESLGLALPGTVLFATKILLVEGDSDPIFIHSVLLKLVEMGRLRSDFNALSVISTGESKNADAIVRILTESPVKPKIALLFDGDTGGKERQKYLSGLMKLHGIQSKVLASDTTIEDYIFNPEGLFVASVASYVAKVAGLLKSDDLDKNLSTFTKSYADKYESATSENVTGLAAWSRSEGRLLGKLEQEPSSVGIAREYAIALAALPAAEAENYPSERLMKLVQWIVDVLELPNRILSEEKILAD